jgi:hypothetical protein
MLKQLSDGIFQDLILFLLFIGILVYNWPNNKFGLDVLLSQKNILGFSYVYLHSLFTYIFVHHQEDF